MPARFTEDAKKAYARFDLWIREEGLRSALLRAKRVRHAALNSMLGQPDPEYPFLATHKGFPICVLFLRKYTKDDLGKRAVLTVLSDFTRYQAPGPIDLGSITEPGLSIPEEIINEISSLIRKDEKIDLTQAQYLFRSKRGPNGQAVYTAGLDAVALANDPSLKESCYSLLDLQSEDLADDLIEMTNECQSENDPNHSKLSIKREYGGKDRVFAIFDYYSQVALRPLHKAMNRLLQRIPQDFTFNQEDTATTIRSWYERGVNSFHSLDLSSATDRFPAILQKKVVEKLVSAEFADH